MKSILKKATLFVFLMTFITACHVNGFNRIKGNKYVVTKERTLTKDFTKIDVSQGITVLLTMGSKVLLAVEADENLHEYIKTEVVNGVLKIYTAETISKAKSRKVYITAPNVNAIEASSGSKVVSENTLRATNFTVSSSSGANINLTLKSENVVSKSSSGSYIKLSGRTETHTTKASSGSSIAASDLKSQEAIAGVSSGASIKLNVIEELTAKASSGGGINYKGNPKKVERKSSSGGSISSY